MSKKTVNNTLIFLLVFIVTNIINARLILSPALNRYITPIDVSVLGIINSVVGDIIILSLICLLLMILLKRRISVFIALIVITFIFNMWLLQVLSYTTFMQAIPTFRLIRQTVGNPVEGLWTTVAAAQLRMILFEFRWLHFTPFIILVVMQILIFRKDKDNIVLAFRIPFKKSIIFMTIAIMFFGISVFATSTMMSNSQVSNFNRPLSAIKHGGFYSFNLQNLLNIGVPETEVLDEDLTKLVEKFNVNIHDDMYGRYWNELAQDYFYRVDNQTGIFDNQNVFIIQLEAFNNFLIDLEINDIEVMPFMNRFVRGNLPESESLRPKPNVFYFNNVLQVIGRGNTSDSEFSTLTGLMGMHDDRLLQMFEADLLANRYSHDFDSLPKLFNSTHETMYFHGNTPVFYRRRASHRYLFEFEHMFFRDDFLYKHNVTHQNELDPSWTYKGWIIDELMLEWSLRESLKILYDEYGNSTGQNFFNFTVLLQPHAPFLHRGSHDEMDWGREINSNVHLSAYLNWMHHFDTIIEDFMLRAMYKLPNTLFVLYGDHGIVGGVRGNGLRSLLEVDTRIEETLGILQIPFIFVETPPRDADSNWVGRIQKSLSESDYDFDADRQQLRSHRDIFRTIVNFFDLWDETREVFGVNMFSNEPTYAIAVRTSYIKTDDFFSNFMTPSNNLNFTGVSLEEITRQRNVIRQHRDMNLFFLNNRRNLIRDVSNPWWMQ